MDDYPAFADFSEAMDVTGLDREGRAFSLKAAGEDLAALAEFLGAVAVKKLMAQGQVSRHGDLVRVSGTVDADLVRQCVATLEPVEELIKEPFEVTYSTAPPRPESREELEADLDAPEPLDGPILDLAHTAIEQVVLAMSPHPRQKGVDAIADPGAGVTISPFDVLKGLKDGN
ncbi:MAG: YceD family protein [Parvularcula sp.]